MNAKVPVLWGRSGFLRPEITNRRAFLRAKSGKRGFPQVGRHAWCGVAHAGLLRGDGRLHRSDREGAGAVSGIGLLIDRQNVHGPMASPSRTAIRRTPGDNRMRGCCRTAPYSGDRTSDEVALLPRTDLTVQPASQPA